ncbi:mitochondrial import protein [Hirsutella rhossiliensis]|uniref:Presequence translocated-associated motor subunit PAM17 n=1 Tax=Hirsutella rhossiliensis TaxID=111463 RepID=A0A9P8MV80_9HYPO|nr:mitochondrial import protein [Hirsutella rhossiliensis]KAH0962798.1 mitochondrial import protein [Hirsutella rhossiliensis]
MSSAFRTLAMRWPPQQSLVRACPKASFSTCFAQPPPRQRPACDPTVSRRWALRPKPTPLPARPVPAARCFAKQASASASKPALDWNSFFQLRLRRRRIQIAFSVAGGLMGGAGGAILVSTGLAEPLVMQVPLDPFFTLGLMTLACAGMGWLVGPSLGNQVFYILNRRLKVQMMDKESEFFARVKKNRVDPSNSSAGNPVPDFYGEKIQSVLGYRRWLKDQRAFNKKKTANFV